MVAKTIDERAEDLLKRHDYLDWEAFRKARKALKGDIAAALLEVARAQREKDAVLCEQQLPIGADNCSSCERLRVAAAIIRAGKIGE